MHDIGTLFLIFSLFFPRITLLVTYFAYQIPFNTVPFALDVIAAIFLPRFLITFYVYQNLGIESPWFWVNLVLAVISVLSPNRYTS